MERTSFAGAQRIRSARQEHLLTGAIDRDGIVKEVVPPNGAQDRLRIELGIEHDGMVAPRGQIGHQVVRTPKTGLVEIAQMSRIANHLSASG